MKKIARADMKKYGVPPKHFGVNSVRLQGEAESGLKSFWIGVSHYLPGGGIEWSGEDSAEEKVYHRGRGRAHGEGRERGVRARSPGLALHRPA